VRHKLTGKVRAMRIIKKELIEVREEETLLFKELALLRTLDHPNIIKLYEFYRDDKYYYLLSEYCEEGELFKIIKKEGKGFEEYTVAHIMRQLLSVVYYSHSGNIINRDLRPENMLVESIDYKVINNQELPFYNIRVTDFKSARSYKNSKKLNKKVGNPYYIAPEVLKRKYNEKCDLWSCGVVMYILLTGKPPFSGSTDKEVLDKVETGIFEFFGK
jgi:calcium-dependent protein kinase